jgi:hypothetical protein
MLQGSGTGQPPQKPAPSQTSGSGEKAIIFSRPEQITEILTETENLKLPVLIRYTNDGKAVRGFVERANIAGEGGIRIAGISAAGDAVLASYDVLKIEFVLLSKKLYFVTKVRARTTSRILINTPAKLYAVERRRNARFTIPAGIGAFLEFTDVAVDLTRFDSPFNPDITGSKNTMALRLRIDDISLGGTALSTRFSGIPEVLKPTGDNVVVAKLLLPKTAPISVPVAIRWSKKSTIRLVPGKHDEASRIITSKIMSFGVPPETLQFNEIYQRYGVQFAEISNDLDSALRDFIHICQTAESV